MVDLKIKCTSVPERSGGRSSIGRAADSSSAGCWFESNCPAFVHYVPLSVVLWTNRIPKLIFKGVLK